MVNGFSILFEFAIIIAKILSLKFLPKGKEAGVPICFELDVQHLIEERAQKKSGSKIFYLSDFGSDHPIVLLIK